MGIYRVVPIGYVVAVLATLAMFALRWILEPLLGGQVPLAMFLLVVFIAGFSGGFGPGILATLLGVFGGTYFFVPPQQSFQLQTADQHVAIILFVVEGVLISGLSEAFRVANQRAMARMAAQHEAENQAITILNSTTDCYYSLDAAWRFTFVNSHAERFLGIDRGQLLGREFWETFSGARGSVLESNYRKALADQVPVYFECYSVTKPDRWMDIRVYPSPKGLSVFFRDITEQRDARAAIAASEEQLQLITDALPVLVCYVDRESFYRFNNAAYETWFGIPREEIQGKQVREIVGDAAFSKIEPRIARALAGEATTFDTVIGHVDGLPRDVSVSYVPHRAPSGEVMGFVALGADITERKEMERRQRFLVEINDLLRNLGHPEEMLQMVVAASCQFFGVTHGAFWELDANGEVAAGTEHGSGKLLTQAEQNRGLFRLPPATMERLSTGETQVIEDSAFTSSSGGESGAHLATDFRGMLAVPLVKDGRLMAIYTLSDGESRKWLSAEVDLAEQVAQRTWLAIESARAEASLRSSEERFRNLANNAPVFVWLSDADHRCHWFNKPWLDFTGRTLEEELGDGWAAGVHPEDRPHCIEIYHRSLREQKRFTLEYRFCRHDGEYRWLLDNGIPLHNPDGTYTGHIGSRIDISDRKRIEEERETLLASERYARSEAEKASRTKDEFLSTLSHELRTPLNAILGWTTVLRSGRVNQEDITKGLEVIDRNVRIQARLIEDLLDMSRIMSGKLRLDVSRVSLSSIIEAAIESIQPASDAKQIRILKILDPTNDIIYGDASRLQQVIWNLLSNAVKFTPKEGKVTVVLERVNSHLEVSVTDTGEGIDPDFLPLLFERFRQSDGSTTRKHGGLGLGLAIVKQLTELHGGTVRALSPGKGLGATFTLTLPLAAVVDGEEIHSGNDGLAAESILATPSLDGVKVLVVDDEPDARELVRRLVSDHSANVETAGTADEALEILQRFHPDVLVSDIGMPEKDGYELIRQVRTLAPEAGGATPAAALTAFARSEDRRRALIAGYQTHVAKPVDPAELITIIASLAGRTGSLGAS